MRGPTEHLENKKGSRMNKFIAAIGFLSGNYLYQYMQDVPDYMLATERTWFQAFAMLFTVLYLKLKGWDNDNK